MFDFSLVHMRGLNPAEGFSGAEEQIIETESAIFSAGCYLRHRHIKSHCYSHHMQQK